MKRIIFFAWMLLGCQLSVSAQQCSGPVRMMVGLAPGGGMDIIARVIAQRYSEKFGRVMIVENRVGAGGNLAAQAGAKARPDGCTLILVGDAHNRNPMIYAKAGYQAEDFDPVVLAVTGTPVLLAGNRQPFKSLQELIEYATANPGKLSYGTSGVGSTHHVAMEKFFRAAHIDFVHVPYKGASQSISDAAAGVLPLAVGSVAAALPFIVSGKVIALAVTGPTRWPTLPQVPTFAEAGYLAAVTTSWTGILAPAGTPAPIREKLNRELRSILQEDAMRERFMQLGFVPEPGSVDDFRRFLQDDQRAMRGLMAQLKLQVD